MVKSSLHLPILYRFPEEAAWQIPLTCAWFVVAAHSITCDFVHFCVKTMFFPIHGFICLKLCNVFVWNFSIDIYMFIIVHICSMFMVCVPILFKAAQSDRFVTFLKDHDMPVTSLPYQELSPRVRSIAPDPSPLARVHWKSDGNFEANLQNS